MIFKNKLDEEIIQILKTPAVSYAFKDDVDRQKIVRRNALRFWGISIFLTAGLVVMVIKLWSEVGELGDGLFFTALLWVIFECALTFLHLMDRRKFKKYEQGLVIKAYVTDIIFFRGVVVCVTYYDYLRQKTCNARLRDDFGETYLTNVRRDEIIEIVVNEKRGKIVCIGPKK